MSDLLPINWAQLQKLREDFSKPRKDLRVCVYCKESLTVNNCAAVQYCTSSRSKLFPSIQPIFTGLRKSEGFRFLKCDKCHGEVMKIVLVWNDGLVERMIMYLDEFRIRKIAEGHPLESVLPFHPPSGYEVR